MGIKILQISFMFIGCAIYVSSKVTNPLSGFAHNLHADDVTLLGNGSLFITNLTYDGLSPDGRFIVGEGEPNAGGIIIKDEKGFDKKLTSYYGQDVMLQVPKDLEIDWFGVWCLLDKENIGSVLLQKIKRQIDTTPINTLHGLNNPVYGISSKEVELYGENIVRIVDLTYNGAGNGAVFWVGEGSEPSEEGMEVPYGDGGKLNTVNKKTIDVTLNGSFYDYDWISMWSPDDRKSLAHIRLHPDTTRHVPLEAFNESDVTSGPILMLDDRTFFITNLHLEGDHLEARFWAGSSSNGPKTDGFFLNDENNTTKVLGRYNGEDIMIQLPHNMNRENIKYMGVWSNVFNMNLAYIKTPYQHLGFNNNNTYDDNGNYIARIPKCCPVGYAKSVRGCVVQRRKVNNPISIYLSNITNFDDEPIQNVVYEYYTYKPPCKYGMYSLELKEEFYLLTTGLLLDGDESLSKNSYCIDKYPYSEGDELYDIPFVCFEREPRSQNLNTMYAVFIYISAIFLICTSGIFIFVKRARDTRGFNVVGYTVSMAASFICLATARLTIVNDNTCKTISFVYQFLLLCSFTWLFCLTFETYYKVTRYNVEYKKRRLILYVIASLIVPMTAVITSILTNDLIPDRFNKPSATNSSSCAFRTDKKVVFYYIPIIISIICNIVLNILTRKGFKENEGEPMWKVEEGTMKNVFRSNYIILIIMTICWVADVISYIFETNNGFWIAIDCIDSLQGVFVFLVFVFHEPVSDILKARWKAYRKGDDEDNMDYFDREYMMPERHNVAMTQIQHVNSVENLFLD